MSLRKRTIIWLIVLVTIAIYLLYILYLSHNEQYNYIPFVLGSFMMFAILGVKNYK